VARASVALAFRICLTSVKLWRPNPAMLVLPLLEEITGVLQRDADRPWIGL